MTKYTFRVCLTTCFLLISCVCQQRSTDNQGIITPTKESTPKYPAYYNLEAIDLKLAPQENLSFSFHGKELIKEGVLYVSENLMVYQTDEGKWQATVIGKGGIEGNLQIFSQGELIQESPIQTTNKVFPYQDKLGREWPSMHNIGNTCFANAIYKLIARCPGFDPVLGQDMEGNIHTALRNIVNGIRLGNRSALNTAMINKEVSKQFLKLMSDRADGQFNHGNGSDGGLFYQYIAQELYSDRAQKLDDFNKIEELIHQPTANEPFEKISQSIDNKEAFYTNFPLITYDLLQNFLATHPKYNFVKTPRYFIVTYKGPNQSIKKIVDKIQIPLFDYKTGHPITEKTYRLIAFDKGGGHRITYTHFDSDGWYIQDDLRVEKVDFASINMTPFNTLAIYELQE